MMRTLGTPGIPLSCTYEHHKVVKRVAVVLVSEE
jgi:hypothetical protein